MAERHLARVALAAVLGLLALCALVLDVFEILFVVMPVVLPPLLTVTDQPTWAGVLALLVLQQSFQVPPFGYAVVVTRHATGLAPRGLARALAPYLGVQLAVLVLVLAVPALVWQRTPLTLGTTGVSHSEDDERRMLEQQLEQLTPPAEPDEPAR